MRAMIERIRRQATAFEIDLELSVGPGELEVALHGGFRN